jgi:polysaccharide biosynthesis/export protein
MKTKMWKMKHIFPVACALIIFVSANGTAEQVGTLTEIPEVPAETEIPGGTAPQEIPEVPAETEIPEATVPTVEVPEIDFTEPEVPSIVDEAEKLPEEKTTLPTYESHGIGDKEELSAFQQYLMKQLPLTVSRRVNHFGYNFFRTPPSTFAPVESLPVTAGYVIGPGDEIRINVWGMLDAIWNLVVDRTGSINIPTIGPVSVTGLTYEELEPFIKKELSKQYKEFHLNVNMGRLRTIPVYLVGNVRRPGMYTVSSLSTLVNALFVSGGPTTSGTMRDIRLQRDGETIVRFDMYDFLLRGNKTKDIRLQPEDVIFLPAAGPSAAILGNVKNPAIYELREDTTITDFIKMAGGVSAMGYKKRIQLERIYQNETKIILDRNLDALSAEDDIVLEDSDIVAIYPVSDTIVNAVTLYGNVVRPGQYQWTEGMRVSDIIKDEQNFLPETKLDYALIERMQPSSLQRELLFFNLGKAVIDKDPEEDKLLQPYDTVIVYSKWQFTERFRVQIDSGVHRPGRYIYRENMRISDIVKLAGGLTRPDHPASYLPQGMIIRRMPPDYREENIPFDLGKSVLMEDKEADLLLHPKDRVKIFDHWDIARKRVVRLAGAVNNPGEYRWINNMKVKDLINLAGGLEDFAYTLEAELTRVVATNEGPETKYLYVNLQKVLQDDPAHNILLDYNDYLFIRPVPEWQLYQTVHIRGEVKFPGVYTIKKGTTITALLDRAGGFTDDAYIRGAVFTREEVRKNRREQMDEMIDQIEMELLAPRSLPAEATQADMRAEEMNLARKREFIAKLKAIEPDGRMVISLQDASDKSIYDIELKDGDTLSIPENPGRISVLGAVYNPSAFIYDSRLNHSRYLQMAGGFTPTANRRELYVIKVDSTVVKPGRNYALEPGDAIAVPEKLEIISAGRHVRNLIESLYRIAVTVAVTKTIF